MIYLAMLMGLVGPLDRVPAAAFDRPAFVEVANMKRRKRRRGDRYHG